jgi:hypothetical protein
MVVAAARADPAAASQATGGAEQEHAADQAQVPCSGTVRPHAYGDADQHGHGASETNEQAGHAFAESGGDPRSD